MVDTFLFRSVSKKEAESAVSVGSIGPAPENSHELNKEGRCKHILNEDKCKSMKREPSACGHISLTKELQVALYFCATWDRGNIVVTRVDFESDLKYVNDVSTKKKLAKYGFDADTDKTLVSFSTCFKEVIASKSLPVDFVFSINTKLLKCFLDKHQIKCFRMFSLELLKAAKKAGKKLRNIDPMPESHNTADTIDEIQAALELIKEVLEEDKQTLVSLETTYMALASSAVFHTSKSCESYQNIRDPENRARGTKIKPAGKRQCYNCIELEKQELGDYFAALTLASPSDF